MPAAQLDGRGFIFLFWFCLFFPLSLSIISNARAERSKSISEDKRDLEGIWTSVFNTPDRIPQEATVAPQSSRAGVDLQRGHRVRSPASGYTEGTPSSQAHVLNHFPVSESKTQSQISPTSSTLSLRRHHVQSHSLDADSADEGKVGKQHACELWTDTRRGHTPVPGHTDCQKNCLP